MQLTIKHEKKAPLLQRKEVTAEITHPGAMTPKNVDVKKALAEHYKVTEETVAVHKIQDAYGTTITTVTATVYDTPEAFKKFATIAKEPKKQEEGAAASVAKPAGKK